MLTYSLAILWQCSQSRRKRAIDTWHFGDPGQHSTTKSSGWEAPPQPRGKWALGTCFYHATPFSLFQYLIRCHSAFGCSHFKHHVSCKHSYNSGGLSDSAAKQCKQKSQNVSAHLPFPAREESFATSPSHPSGQCCRLPSGAYNPWTSESQ